MTIKLLHRLSEVYSAEVINWRDSLEDHLDTLCEKVSPKIVGLAAVEAHYLIWMKLVLQISYRLQFLTLRTVIQNFQSDGATR